MPTPASNHNIKPRTWLALPGALGGPSDWQSLVPWLSDIGELLYWDWHDAPSADWLDLAAEFAAALHDHPRPWGLLGYSQGGRAALAALAQAPDQFTAACLIGAHPGLQDNESRKNRKVQDKMWATRAEQDDWQTFLTAWNQRGALAEGTSIEKWQPSLAIPWQEQKHTLQSRRTQAAEALRKWSLARQPNLWPELPRITTPILWLTGGLDSTFREIARKACPLLFNASHHIVPDAGHRVPWEKPEKFANILQTWLTAKFVEAME